MKTHTQLRLFFVTLTFSLSAQLTVADELLIFDYPFWKHESELGLVVSGGNSVSRTASLRQKTGYYWVENTVALSGHYLYGASGSNLSAQNWDLALRYDHSLSYRLALFVSPALEGDIFSGYRLRIHQDIGLQWAILKGRDDSVLSELGYRFTHEKLASPAITRNLHFSRLYAEGETKLSPTVIAKLWIEYLANWSEWSDYRINFEPSLRLMLSEALSLKTGFEGRYLNVPVQPEFRRLDYRTVTALVAKF